MKSLTECKALVMNYFRNAYDASRAWEAGEINLVTVNRQNDIWLAVQNTLYYIYGEEGYDETIKAWKAEYVKQYKETHK